MGKLKSTNTKQLSIQLIPNRLSNHFNSFIKYGKGIREYVTLHAPRRRWIPTVIVLWGPTGTGKTSFVWNSHPDNEIYPYAGEGSGIWFDGYYGQPIALFDEFHGGMFRLPYLLKLLDCFPMCVPIKGGFVSWVPKTIYLTSNINPLDWFPNANAEHVAALFRRITEIKNML